MVGRTDCQDKLVVRHTAVDLGTLRPETLHIRQGKPPLEMEDGRLVLGVWVVHTAPMADHTVAHHLCSYQTLQRVALD